jgi:hypothetical protein
MITANAPVSAVTPELHENPVTEKSKNTEIRGLNYDLAAPHAVY